VAEGRLRRFCDCGHVSELKKVFIHGTFFYIHVDYPISSIQYMMDRIICKTLKQAPYICGVGI
jgi:hypothetical protein